MSELSPEERQRIYHEEKARFEAQEEFKTQAKKKTDRTEGRNLLIALLIVGSIVWYMWSSASSAIEESTPSGSAAMAEGLSVVDWDWKRNPQGQLSIVGTVKNASSKTYSYAQVQFNLYDQSGALVGSTLANINNLGPQGTWKFEAPVLQATARKASVAKVTAF